MSTAPDWDVIVVGARVAGSPLSMLLAREGHRVLVVDRATFPSEKVCTHLLSPLAIQYLARWDLLEDVIASGCPPIRATRMHMEGSVTRFPYVEANGFAETYAPRRTVLDTLLVRAAEEAGANVRQGCSVTDLLSDADRVVGVRLGDVAATARFIVGADGVHSLVARRVGAATYNLRPPLGLSCHAYWADAEVSDAEFGYGPALGIAGIAVGAIPTNDGLVGVFIGGGSDGRGVFDGDFDAACLMGMREVAPDLNERFAGARRVGHVYRRGYMPAYYRVPCGPGWALVGDAGFIQWPSTGHGITDAFRDASLLADALHAVLTDVSSEEDAMTAYQRTRDEASQPLFEAVHGTGVPDTPSMDFAQALWQEAFAGPLTLSVPV